MLISSAAYFKTCSNCGRHGRLYTADGKASRVVFSKENALTDLNEAIMDGRVTSFEIPEAKRQIMTSKLPRYQADLSSLAELLSEISDACETARKNGDESDDDNPSFHETIH